MGPNWIYWSYSDTFIRSKNAEYIVYTPGPIPIEFDTSLYSVQDMSSNYILVTPGTTWDNADLYCYQVFGTQLATIESSENSEAKSLCSNGGAQTEFCWIGFNDIDIEGTYVWSSGDSVSYTNWDTSNSQPTGNSLENGVVINPTDGLWSDIDTDLIRPFLCNRIYESAHYHLDASLKQQNTANDLCNGLGLASINSQDENDEAQRLCANAGIGGTGCWTGLQYSSGNGIYFWRAYWRDTSI